MPSFSPLLQRGDYHDLETHSVRLPHLCFETDDSSTRIFLPNFDAARLTLVATLSPNAATNANLIHTVLVEGVSKVGKANDDGVEVLESRAGA